MGTTAPSAGRPGRPLGIYGDALIFNGANALVTINNSTSLQLSSAMTLEAWVNPSTVSNVWCDVIYKGNDNYYLEGTSGNGGVPAMGGTFGAADVALYGTEPLPVNTWTYLAATYDGTTTAVVCQWRAGGEPGADGRDRDLDKSVADWRRQHLRPVFQGTIDEVRVYNRALTATQIQADMNTPFGNIPTAPGNLTATVISTNQVNLSWTASTGNLGVSGYLGGAQPGSGQYEFCANRRRQRHQLQRHRSHRRAQITITGCGPRMLGETWDHTHGGAGVHRTLDQPARGGPDTDADAAVQADFGK